MSYEKINANDLDGDPYEIWDLVAHLTYATSAGMRTTMVAIRTAEQKVQEYSICSSCNVRSHYDIAIGDDGANAHFCPASGARIRSRSMKH